MTDTTTLERPAVLGQEAFEGIIKIAAGRMMATLMQCALRMDLFEKLKQRGEPVALQELGEVWEMSNPSARVMAQGLAHIGLLTFEEGKISLPPHSAAILCERGTVMRREVSKVLQFDLTADELKERLLDPPVQHWYQILEEGEIVDTSSLIRQKADRYLDLWRGGLHEERLVSGNNLAKEYDFSEHKVLLDLGGASGGWSMGVRQRNPDLQCVVFDVPDAVAVANEKIAEAGVEEHMRAVGGSVFDDPLPGGVDVVLMANFFHCWTEEDGKAIARKVFEILPPGGKVVVKEPMFEDDWTGNLQALMYSFILSGAEGKGGRQCSYGEMEELLGEAGFTDFVRGQDLLVARKP